MAYIPDEVLYCGDEVSQAAHRIYTCYCGHRDHSTGTSRPGRALIHKETALNVSYISTCKKELVAKGWIEILQGDEVRLLKGDFSPVNKGAMKQKTVGNSNSKPTTPAPIVGNSNSCSAESVGNSDAAEMEQLDNPTVIVGNSNTQFDIPTPTVGNSNSPYIEPEHRTRPLEPEQGPDHREELNTGDNATTNGNGKKRKARPPAELIELPDWLPLDVWGEWVDYRRQRKLTLVPNTLNRQITFLDSERARGHPPEAVIGQSIEKGWQGLFELKTNGTGMVANGRGITHEESLQIGVRLVKEFEEEEAREREAQGRGN